MKVILEIDLKEEKDFYSAFEIISNEIMDYKSNNFVPILYAGDEIENGNEFKFRLMTEN